MRGLFPQVLKSPFVGWLDGWFVGLFSGSSKRLLNSGPEKEHIWEFVRMGSKRKGGRGKGSGRARPTTYTTHSTPLLPQQRVSSYLVASAFCAPAPSLGLPSCLPSRFRYSTSGGPSQLYLPTSASESDGGGVPHHVRVTRESAKGRGRDLAARLRPMRVVRGPLPIHVSKQASNLPCLNQGSPRAAAASLTSFGPWKPSRRGSGRSCD